MTKRLHSEAGEPPLGVLMLDHDLVRPPGDVGNPATFPFPTRQKTVGGVSLERLIHQGDLSILEPLVNAARELVEEGAWGITTGCGFFAIFQPEMAAALAVPVFLSGLLQIPFAQRIVGPEARVGVLTAHAGRLTREHLLLAGMDPARPAAVMGLENEPNFHRGVLLPGQGLDMEAVEREVVAKARELAAEEGVRALVLECTNLPPYARAIRAATGLPVFDVTTMIEHVRSSLFGREFGEKEAGRAA